MAEDGQDGLQIIMTPAQLAAVLMGATISPPEGLLSRLWHKAEGGLDVVFGGIELIGTAALLATPDPTFLTKLLASALFVHGCDTLATGMVEMAVGNRRVTMTAQAVAAAARNLGYDPDASS